MSKIEEIQARITKAKTPQDMMQILEDLKKLPLSFDTLAAGLSVFSIATSKTLEIINSKIEVIAKELERLEKEVRK